MTRRAAQEEFDGWVRQLRQWQEPARFAEVVGAMDATLGSHAIDQAGSPFRDAWIASKCAAAAGASAVRPGEDPPDFELMFGNAATPCEAVEVMDPRRRRGAELTAEREQEAAGTMFAFKPLEHVPTGTALAWLRERASAKAVNRYARGTVLVAYLNVGFVEDEEEFRQGWAAAVSAALAVFAEVWLLDQGHIHRLRGAIAVLER